MNVGSQGFEEAEENRSDSPSDRRFWHARLLEGGRHLTQAYQIVGTLQYMSPEQALGRDVDGRSDLYSLAAVFYELLVGEPAVRARTLQETLLTIANETPRTPRNVDPTIVAGVNDAIMRGLSKDPDQRFQTARELVDALSSEATTGEQTLPPIGATAPQTEQRSPAV